MADFDDLMPHLVLCGFTFNSNMAGQLTDFLISAMTEHGIGSLIITKLEMVRNKLITMEASRMAYDGKLKNDEDGNNYEGSIYDHYKGSIYDELESFQNNLFTKIENVRSVFLPKMRDDELKLVDNRDEDYMESFLSKFEADINKTEMALSESNGKFLYSQCFRETTVLNVCPDHSKFKTPINTIVRMDPKKGVTKDDGEFKREE